MTGPAMIPDDRARDTPFADWELPEAVDFGGVRFGKGVKLSTVFEAARRWLKTARGAYPVVKPEEIGVLFGAGAPAPGAGTARTAEGVEGEARQNGRAEGAATPSSNPDQRAVLKEENDRLREIISQAASAIGNGACIGVQCSLDFMSYLPGEIAGVTGKLRAERDTLQGESDEVRAECDRLAEQLRYSELGHIERDMAGEEEAEALQSQQEADKARIGVLEDERDQGQEALHRIAQWADAYPLKLFPEPDWRKARALLEAGGMTLDSVSASAMRRVVEGVGKIAKDALLHPEQKP